MQRSHGQRAVTIRRKFPEESADPILELLDPDLLPHESNSADGEPAVSKPVQELHGSELPADREGKGEAARTGHQLGGTAARGPQVANAGHKLGNRDSEAESIAVFADGVHEDHREEQ